MCAVGVEIHGTLFICDDYFEQGNQEIFQHTVLFSLFRFFHTHSSGVDSGKEAGRNVNAR